MTSYGTERQLVDLTFPRDLFLKTHFTPGYRIHEFFAFEIRNRVSGVRNPQCGI